MVGTAGIEPARDFSQRILSPLRLPIPPRSQSWLGSEKFPGLDVSRDLYDPCSSQAESIGPALSTREFRRV